MLRHFVNEISTFASNTKPRIINRIRCQCWTKASLTNIPARYHFDNAVTHTYTFRLNIWKLYFHNVFDNSFHILRQITIKQI